MQRRMNFMHLTNCKSLINLMIRAIRPPWRTILTVRPAWAKRKFVEAASTQGESIPSSSYGIDSAMETVATKSNHQKKEKKYFSLRTVFERNLETNSNGLFSPRQRCDNELETESNNNHHQCNVDAKIGGLVKQRR